jgi:hypothetical protein
MFLLVPNVGGIQGRIGEAEDLQMFSLAAGSGGEPEHLLTCGALWRRR